MASSHVFTNSQMHTFSWWKERSAAFKIVCTLRLRPGKPYANLMSAVSGDSRTRLVNAVQTPNSHRMCLYGGVYDQPHSGVESVKLP
jgi:hypothetical protein